jgi:hypothetical protein
MEFSAFTATIHLSGKRRQKRLIELMAHEGLLELTWVDTSQLCLWHFGAGFAMPPSLSRFCNRQFLHPMES